VGRFFPTRNEENEMEINEKLARQNKENYSFSGYQEGSATAEFNAIIAEASKKIEEAKLKVSEEGQTRLDKLLASYTAKYANWINKSNSNGANHVSVMIAGPANYNMRAHEKYMARENKLWEEYESLKDIDSKIYTIIKGDKIIKSDDVNALEKLKEKLAKAQEEHQGYKDFNINARKNGTETLGAYVLQNSNGRIKGIKDRILYLEKLEKMAEATMIEDRTKTINGIEIIDNIEIQRVQIIFPDKPNTEVRQKLKHNGFRWSPSNGAWQSYRSKRALEIAAEVAKNC